MFIFSLFFILFHWFYNFFKHALEKNRVIFILFLEILVFHWFFNGFRSEVKEKYKKPLEIQLFQQINAWRRVVKGIWAAQAAQEAGRLGWHSWPRTGPAGPSGLGHTPPPPSGSPLSLPPILPPLFPPPLSDLLSGGLLLSSDDFLIKF